MRITAADLAGGLLFLSIMATGDSMAETANFDSLSPGALPAQWVCGVTGSGASRWTVEPDADAPSKPNIVKQSGIGDYPWCALKAASMTDGHEKAHRSHYENNCGGAVKRLNQIAEYLGNVG